MYKLNIMERKILQARSKLPKLTPGAPFLPRLQSNILGKSNRRSNFKG